MKRTIIFSLALAVALSLPLYAQLNAVVKEFSGKVEIQPSGQGWVPVAVNMTLANGTLVSTGFNSRLVVAIGLTQLTVNPLTRMTLDEIVKKESTNSSSLTLKVGKVFASVKSAAGERTEFTLKGPASTAAVRGTEFNYDGYVLQVTEGVVQFVNLLSQARPVGAGEISETNGYGVPTSGEQENEAASNTTGASGGGLLTGGEGGGGGSFQPTATTGNFTLTVH
jgi:hypothetical protein